MSMRRNLPREDNISDPLANVDNFNIIQFLAAENEFNLPLEEPLDPIIHNPMRQHHNVVQDPQHNNSLYQLSTGRLPDSPPITDISGNGSSASPSSNSDPPYSPENFNGFGSVMSNNGIILGVHELQNNLLQQDYMRQGLESRSGDINSPQSAACFMSPYPPSQQPTPASMAQVSPPSSNRNENFTISNYPHGQMDTLYNMLNNASSEGSLNSQNSEAPINRKRPRLESQQSPVEQKFMPAGLGQNPAASSPIDGFPDENFSQQIIKFNKFQEEQWNSLYDIHGRELKQLQVHVVADKGFNHSSNDGCFVNQKKNHFQISVHVEASDSMPPMLVQVNGSLVAIKDFKLAFCGVKAEMPSSEVTIRQSRTDRKPHPHNPVLFKIEERRVTKVTVPRLHFSETTLNNQRKNFRPNPEQKYFLLVVRLFASISDKHALLIQSYASERVIVRATNPGSFEPPDTDVTWFKNGNALYSNGPVSIGTEKTRAKLTVDGDIYTTGRVVCPSDIRLKENITEKQAREALDNLCKLRIVDYFYKPEVAEKWGLTEEQRRRTGVIAQELAAVLPDAVRDIGDYLTVNESRVFYETVLATQELCRLTGDLDNKIDEKVEEISQRLAQYARRKKLLSSKSSNLNDFDSKSMLSYSRTSLASSTATNHRDTRRSHRKKSSSSHDATCSSKFAQGTIITLVSVMAVCLVAMSSLYVLDWHNRNYGYHHVYQPYVPPKEKEGPDQLVMLGHHIPVFQPDAPPLMSQCFSAACKSYCCTAGRLDEPIEDEDPPRKPKETKTNQIARSPFTSRSFGTGVQIMIPSMNMTIDQRYCIEKSCSKRRGLYNLFIPVTQYLPDAPVEVQFKIPRAKITNNCGYISDFNHKLCPLSRYHMKNNLEYPISDEIAEDIYELSVGAYIQSAYRFRVSFTTESCFTNEEGLNGNYEEYNLVFYRTCQAANNETASATTPASAIDTKNVRF